jgi:UDP-N-acetyl-D-mannosaminuronic acid transferase (WecB/TagA/CpsF family)
MDPSSGIVSYSFFGIRVDIATSARATLSIWESALARSGLRIVLADLWTFLFAQRDYSVWEALSSADYVLPAGNPTILRRLMRSHDVPILQPELLLADLFGAATRNDKVVALLAPEDEVSADVALARQIWPSLRAASLTKNTLNMSNATDPELARAVNTMRPDVLVVGGDSPWQERWMHEHRGTLDVGVAIMLPTLHAALAACAQRAGVPVAGLGRMRRRAALQRALATTIGPMATASAATVSSWLQEARGGLSEWSEALQVHRTPAALKRLDPLALPGSHVTVHVAELRDRDEIEAARRLGAPPLARLTLPSRLPAALPAAEQQTDERRAAFADQPTVALSLDALRGNTPPPQVVTGYVVETIDTTPSEQEEHTASTTDHGREPGDERGDNVGALPQITPGQLAPTTRLAARLAAAATAASSEAASPPDIAPPAEPGPTQRLPLRVPYVPNLDDLPPTTRLRPPEPPAACESPPPPLMPSDAEQAPAAEFGAGHMTAPQPDVKEVVASGSGVLPLPVEQRVSGRTTARPSRARRLYKAKRPRRQIAIARRRRRKPSQQIQRG